MENKFYSINLDKDNDKVINKLSDLIDELKINEKIIVIINNEDSVAEYNIELVYVFGNEMIVAGMFGNGRETCEFFDEDNSLDCVEWLIENASYEYVGSKYKIAFYKEEL